MIEKKIKSQRDFIFLFYGSLIMKHYLSQHSLNQIIVKNQHVLSSFAKKYSYFLKHNLRKTQINYKTVYTYQLKCVF